METKKKGAPKKGPNSVRFELNKAQSCFVNILIRKGTYGEDATDVVKSLLNAQLQWLQKEAILPAESQEAEIHPLPSQKFNSQNVKEPLSTVNVQQNAQYESH